MGVPRKALDGTLPPGRIEAERFLLRAWTAADAPLFKRALDASLPKARQWIPWAVDEPSPVSILEERLQAYHDDLLGGRDALYALMDRGETEVLGGAGLYRRGGPNVLEIGCWTRSDCVGRGFRTETTTVLTVIGFSLESVDRIEIHCAEENAAGVAIPCRLGYRQRETLPGGGWSPTEFPRDLMVWELSCDEFRRSGIRMS